MKNTLSTLCFVMIMSLFFSCTSSPKSGEKAPEVSAETTTGDKFDIASLKGNYVLIDFWGSWCGPCLREAPALVAFNSKYSDAQFNSAEGFKTVSIALEKKDGNWQKVVEKYGFDWEHQIVEKVKYVRSSDYASTYGVTDIPAKFLIGPEGDVLLSLPSFPEMEALLDADLK